MAMLAKKHPVLIFFLIACLWSWSLWIPGVVTYNVQNLDTLPVWVIILGLIGSYGPTVASIVTQYMISGWQGVKKLGGRFKIWRAKPIWYAFVLLLPPAILCLALFLYDGRLGEFMLLPGLLYIPLVWLTALPFGPLGEELGWRGFAQVHLQSKISVFTSALLVGLMWGLWHIPLFWFPGAALGIAETGQFVPMLLYVFNVMIWSLLYAIVLNKTGGSVFMAVVFHMVINSTGRIIFPMFPNISESAISVVSNYQLLLTLAIVVIVAVIYRRLLFAVQPQLASDLMPITSS